MQLAKLEIKGFKSFGEKVTIHFDAGITGIVGPNGCGKSNVVDSIRWVLGEQKTKALRSDKMENVIFNGTKNRRALQMAEVSLTFNNSRNVLPTEYSQVTITRRYYRSGESEYLLNNVTCRLKDITNLFLDTGIGSDSYAIIELKMVDDILNDKDNSRRGLFEEAAGISKFKIRKKESLRKLEDTDGDLARVEDVLFEISKNLKTLEKQAKQAQSYFKLKEEYRQWSIALAHRTVRRQNQIVTTLTEQITAEQRRKHALQQQLADGETAIEREKLALLDKEQLLASRQKALNEYLHKIRQYENEKKVKHERLSFLTEKMNTLREQTDQNHREADQICRRMEQLEREHTPAEQSLRDAETTVQRLQRDHDSQKEQAQALQTESGRINQSYRDWQNAVYQSKKNLEIKQMQLASLRQELEKSDADHAGQRSSLTVFEEKLHALQIQLTERTEQLTAAQQAHQTAQRELTALDKQLEALRQTLSQLNRTHDAKQNEYSLTRSLVDNLEGFPEAIQYLKKHPDFYRQTPLLSDILTCPDEYRVAIENYLEPVMNYYVVPTEAQAYQAIRLLQRAQKGRAYFFVLDQVPDYPASASNGAADTFVAAARIVEYDKKYHHLIGHLLDGVYIQTNGATEFPANSHAIYLTNDGQLAKRRFSISGGSVGAFDGKRIGRARHLEVLQKEITALAQQITQTNAQQRDRQARRSDQLKTLSQHSQRTQQLQREINTLHQERVAVQTKQEQTALLLKNQADRQTNLRDKVARLQTEIARDQPAAEQKAMELARLEMRLNTLNRDLVSQNESFSQTSSAYNLANVTFHQQQNKVAAITQELHHQRQAQAANQQRTTATTGELQRTEAALQALHGAGDVDESALQALYAEKTDVEAGVNEAEKTYYAARGQIDKLEKDVRELSRQRESVDALVAELQNKLNETRLQLTAVRERLSVEFTVDVDEAIPDDVIAATCEVPDEALRTHVQEIKSRMERIGAINPMAMEAYDEIKQRYDFIVAQKQDLLNARQSLMDTITQIDTVARENFMRAYDQIRTNFITVFRSLFSEEDTCDLKLLDPENPLDSAIEIMAKPKGKRPLTINQLSGGEKTLTAISLLFAIYLLKPAPFCIFDEVDAPLDDANIDKFNTIIRKFSSDSQFIIVTHNKRTMSTTDVIYGITMIEAGISAVVPVDLRQLA